jgi:FkbM family methyltransferase
VTAPLVLSTARLFAALLRPLGVTVVCDVGSLNGADALRFRKALPNARILAFEPHPANVADMRRSPRLRDARIEIHDCAVADREGRAELFVVPAEGAGLLARRGMSSLYQRADPRQRGEPEVVEVRRLDGVLTAAGIGAGGIALWIDAEGMAWEVLDGASGIIEHVSLVHVEVETTPCIGARQKLQSDVSHWLRARGFVEVATDGTAHPEQFNVLYVRANLSAKERRALRRHGRRLRLRRRAGQIVLATLPPRVRAWLQMRRLSPEAVRR